MQCVRSLFICVSISIGNPPKILPARLIPRLIIIVLNFDWWIDSIGPFKNEVFSQFSSGLWDSSWIHVKILQIMIHCSKVQTSLPKLNIRRIFDRNKTQLQISYFHILSYLILCPKRDNSFPAYVYCRAAQPLSYFKIWQKQLSIELLLLVTSLKIRVNRKWLRGDKHRRENYRRGPARARAPASFQWPECRPRETSRTRKPHWAR